MKKTFAAVLFAIPLALALTATSAHAAGDGKSPQNNKMKSCSADFKATGQPSSERRAFMSTCMKGSGTKAAMSEEAKAKKVALKEKRKTCSADAKAAGKKGAERTAMVKNCMKA